MKIWHPAPRGLVLQAAAERWTKDNPAPQIVVYLWTWSMHDDGEHPTRRQIARLFGWTEHYSRSMLDRVKTDRAEWQAAYPNRAPGHLPPTLNDTGNLRLQNTR